MADHERPAVSRALRLYVFIALCVAALALAWIAGHRTGPTNTVETCYTAIQDAHAAGKTLNTEPQACRGLTRDEIREVMRSAIDSWLTTEAP